MVPGSLRAFGDACRCTDDAGAKAKQLQPTVLGVVYSFLRATSSQAVDSCTLFSPILYPCNSREECTTPPQPSGVRWLCCRDFFLSISSTKESTHFCPLFRCLKLPRRCFSAAPSGSSVVRKCPWYGNICGTEMPALWKHLWYGTICGTQTTMQGMQDFVKEPVLGLLKSVEDLAPEQLMHGMVRGAGSLLNHSVGGVANSVSLITGVVFPSFEKLGLNQLPAFKTRLYCIGKIICCRVISIICKCGGVYS